MFNTSVYKYRFQLLCETYNLQLIEFMFSHQLLNSAPYSYLDDAPLEERRARAVEMRRLLPASVLEEVGALDQDAIAQVRAEAWPDVRDADELHDALLTLVALPEARAIDDFSLATAPPYQTEIAP